MGGKPVGHVLREISRYIYFCQRSSPSRISDIPQAEFEHAQNLSSGLVELTTTPRRYDFTNIIYNDDSSEKNDIEIDWNLLKNYVAKKMMKLQLL